MKLAYVRWKDACSEEADDSNPRPVTPALCELHEIGFLLGENDEAVTIGMEQGDDTKPGRWRLHIPRSAIQEMRVAELDTAFRKKRRTKSVR